MNADVEKRRVAETRFGVAGIDLPDLGLGLLQELTKAGHTRPKSYLTGRLFPTPG
jgi:hypothetical protein